MSTCRTCLSLSKKKQSDLYSNFEKKACFASDLGNTMGHNSSINSFPLTSKELQESPEEEKQKRRKIKMKLFVMIILA